MSFFKDIEVHPDANFHVFIGCDSTEAFQVAKFTILSLTEDVMSVIPILKEERLLVPAKAKDLKLQGRALYIDNDFVFKEDIKELFNLTFDLKNDRLMWCCKGHQKEDWLRMMIFNLENQKLYDMLPADKVPSWADGHVERFHWISRSNDTIDLEVGNIPIEWQFILGRMKDTAPEAKALNYVDEKPWLNDKCDRASDWYDEYYLFLINYLEPEIKKKTKNV